jgi:hypothetical protein
MFLLLKRKIKQREANPKIWWLAFCGKSCDTVDLSSKNRAIKTAGYFNYLQIYDF